MFWTNYEYLCKKKGMSPNAVASKHLEIKSSGSVTAWKKGVLPRQNTLERIAKFFDVDVNELVGVDLSVKKEPIPSEDELNKYVSVILEELTPDEASKVRAFAAGLIASRTP